MISLWWIVRRRWLGGIVALMTGPMLFPLPIRADKPPAPPPTLAEALAAEKAPVRGVLLAVGAERVTLLRKQGQEAVELDPLDIASFGYETAAFGGVIAVAPTTMVILNEDLATPDVTADLHPFDAFQMLAARLDDAQWRLLTSEGGLGLGDLHDDAQRGLFHALFPLGQLRIAGRDPAMDAVPDAERTDVRDESAQIVSTRLRLGQTSHIYVHDKAGRTIFFGGDRPDAAGRLRILNARPDPEAGEHGVALRAVVPNAAKPSDLKFDTSALQVLVPLAGLKTVGDLVYRVGSLTRTELYADAHYAGRSLTLRGDAPSVPAADLLCALAFCVTGTYRRVGPAFVLTDDRSGVGARRQRLREWGGIAEAQTENLRNQAGLALLEHRASGARTLPSFGDALAMTPEQIKAEKNDDSIPEMPSNNKSDYPFSSLTPAQQDWARRIAGDYETQRSAGTLPTYLTAYNPPGAADLTGNVDLRSENTVQLLLPTVSQPIDTRFVLGPTYMLYWPGVAALEKRQRQTDAQQPKVVPPPPTTPAPLLASVLTSWRRRAVIGHPHTAIEVDALVTAMRKIGLNELWLDVFSDGVARVPGSALAPAAPPVGPDILTEALAQTKGTGITVYADLSLLPWGDAPPIGVRDLDILGRDYRQTLTMAQAAAAEPPSDADGNPVPFAPPPVPVSPASPSVRDDLTTLVRSLAGQEGLAGFIWEDAEADSGLGYTPEMRLAFLRAAHADPIDITPGNVTRTDASLPVFDDEGVESALKDQWGAAQTQANAGLLRAMRVGADTASLPILMEQSVGDHNWLTSWNDSKALPPPLRILSAGDGSVDLDRAAAVARSQGRAILLRVALDADNIDSLARTLKFDRNSAAWDGFVLDFTDAASTRGTTPLAAMVRAVSLSSVLPAHDGK